MLAEVVVLRETALVEEERGGFALPQDLQLQRELPIQFLLEQGVQVALLMLVIVEAMVQILHFPLLQQLTVVTVE